MQEPIKPTPTSTSTPPPRNPFLTPSFSVPWELVIQDLFLLAVIAFSLFREAVKGTILGQVKKVVDNDYEYNKRIDSILYQIQGITNADRVVLGSFHNGSIHTPGNLFNKMSITNEATGITTMPIKKEVKNVPLHTLKNELLQLREKHKWVTTCILDEGLEQDCKNHLILIGTHTISNYLLVYKEVELGILSIQKCSSSFNYSKEIIDDNLVTISALVEVLIAILTKPKPTNNSRLWNFIFKR